MKIRICHLLVVCLFVVSCNNDKANKSRDQNPVSVNSSSTTGADETAQTLKSFYTWYISNAFDSMPKEEQIWDTLDKYCTAAFLDNIRNDSELDADPFTHTQDVDEDWRKTLEVNKVGRGDSMVYSVGFLSHYENKMYNVKVSLKKDAGGWKIDGVSD
jgi:uncharacterized protein DUF3828